MKLDAPSTPSESSRPRQESAFLLFKVVLGYGIFSTLWIYYSDRALLALAGNPATITFWSTIKGWLFTGITTTLLYFLLKRGLADLGKAHAALREREETFRKLFECSNDALSISNKEGFLDANPAMVRLFGCKSREELIALHPGELSPPLQPDGRESFVAAKERLASAIRLGSLHFEWMHKRVDGTLFPAEVMLSRFELHGAPVLQATVRDITGRKREQETLQASEMKLRALVEHVPQPIFVKDRDSVYLTCNRAYARHLGDELAEVAGRTDFDFSPPELAEGYRADDRRVIASGIIESIEEKSCHSGREKWGRVTKVPYRDGEGNIVGVLGIIEDITQRREAEAELRKLSRAVEQSPASVMITNTRGVIEYVNPKFTGITGYTSAEIIGKSPNILKSGEMSLETYRHLWSTITSGRTWQGELHNRKKNGGLYWAWASISPITGASGEITHFVAVNEDITERKQMQEQILRSQRMESIGTLAGGIAHDLNNILAPIVLASQLLVPATEEERRLVASVRESATRATDLVKQLLSFARGVEGRRIELDAAHLIKETEKIVSETFPKNIRINSDVAGDLWRPVADPTQFNQVLMNLSLNARDAMPLGGTLTLMARNARLDEQAVIAHPAARPGLYVVISVADTGGGIPPGIIERIFDPFFTTKQIGKGTGLGLSTTLGIVKSHGGFIDVKSALEAGTTFNVFLPARDTGRPPVEDVETAPPIAHGNGELVLLVDDETSVLGMAQRSLEMFGYRVLIAPGGREALEIFNMRRDEIAVVVTDLMMPVMDGFSTIHALIRIKPDVKIIATTGLAVDTHITAANEAGARHFLPKPYTPKALLDILREALGPDGDGSTGARN